MEMIIHKIKNKKVSVSISMGYDRQTKEKKLA